MRIDVFLEVSETPDGLLWFVHLIDVHSNAAALVRGHLSRFFGWIY